MGGTKRVLTLGDACVSTMVSSVSPVAILMLITAFAITAGGRFSPFGPMGIV